ncbi:hypothetical protein G647_04684 [Cladophialophora carrionii CBS 160.54]|uniref:Uncharacterized protein n=1 Tax=Cladophialophora carrionii CBS 160.54 TaxID=1279043 RepID=V9D7R8_9EURO|nr:uncharacterized protein G647_04684 [Cladophialophora carrionii CBS 160.54]ETI22890.1 hypothetical protein G647_04684 [Cladophialophora carrionii CBS 160.54]
MTSSTFRICASGSRLDTSYVSFESEKGVRSPRTPTYIPDSPSVQSACPFDHTRFFAEPTPETKSRPSLPPPPTTRPTEWIWICHLCHSRYALGVTRRCLVDGHYYCSGESDKPSMRKKKKQKACSSEFDYGAWKMWGEWRRKVLRTIQNDRVFKGCEYCDFPSQCRYPIDTHPLGDLGTASVTPKITVIESDPAVKRKTEQDRAKSKSTANESVDFDQILKSMVDTDVHQPNSDTLKDTTKMKVGGKKKSSGSKDKVPSLELELPHFDTTLNYLVAMDWANFEEIELGKTKLE